MNEALINLLKKYIAIFINEYSKYLNREQLEILKSIDYDKVIHYANLDNPIGTVYLNQIYLSNTIDSVISTMQKMPNYGCNRYYLNNKNYSTYLEYMCYNGYNAIDYYSDHLMYLIFKMVIKCDSAFIWGLITKEVQYLSSKYGLRMVNLYEREEKISAKVLSYINCPDIKKIIFMDIPSIYKYLSENAGYRYAELVYESIRLMNTCYKDGIKDSYIGFDGVINYAKDYDSILYGDVYNHILDFQVSNNLL